MMGTFELTVLPTICVLGVVGAMIYGVRTRRLEVVTAARAEAFAEASEALRSLANIAVSSAVENLKDGLPSAPAAYRAYYYDRAAMIVRSIPASR